MKGSISIILFFLLSGFFLSVLLGAVEHSRRLLAIAGGCLVAVVCVIVFLTPVRLPSWSPGSGDGHTDMTVGSTVTTEAFGVQAR